MPHAWLPCCGLAVSMRSVRLSWVRVVALLVLLLGALQVLHMALLSRLEARNSRSNVTQTQYQIHKYSTAMRTAIERAQIVDASGQYKVVNDLLQGQGTPRKKTGPSARPIDVTLVSHSSIGSLHALIAQSTTWQGPVSVAVFTTPKYLVPTLRVILRLHLCIPAMLANVSVHLVYPLSQATDTVAMHLLPHGQDIACDSLEQDLQHKLSTQHNYALGDTKYPNNLLRNVARRNSHTEYTLVVDVDIRPSANLHQQCLDFLHKSSLSTHGGASKLQPQTVFVLPAFEIESGVSLPKDKVQLLELWQLKHVRPFYVEACSKCQGAVDYDRWRNLSVTSDLQASYTVKRTPSFEPFYISHCQVPLYDERFKQYGYNRMSQVCELHMAGYQFAVLSHAFLLHCGFKRVETFHHTKEREMEENRHLYHQFQEELKAKYPQSHRKC